MPERYIYGQSHPARLHFHSHPFYFLKTPSFVIGILYGNRGSIPSFNSSQATIWTMYPATSTIISILPVKTVWGGTQIPVVLIAPVVAFPICKGNGIDYKMIVEIIGIVQMRRYQHLKAFSPMFLFQSHHTHFLTLPPAKIFPAEKKRI